MILTGGDYGHIVQAEREARFGRKDGGLTVIMPIGATPSTQKVQSVKDACATAHANGQVVLAWMLCEQPVLSQAGFHPDALPTHPSTITWLKVLADHGEAGGLAIVSIMGEFEQYAKWGPLVYTDNYDQIASGLRQGAYPTWERAAFFPKTGPLDYAKWRPSLAVFRGVHLYGSAVDPLKPSGAENVNFLLDPFTSDLPTTSFEGGSTKLDLLTDVAGATKYAKQLVAMLVEPAFKFRQSSSPLNSPWGGQTNPLSWKSGRYCPGAHDPPLNLQSPPWPGSPAMCSVLEKWYAQPGPGWVWAGDELIMEALAGAAVKT